MAARSTMAATNKSLAQMNKTQDVGKATKDGYTRALQDHVLAPARDEGSALEPLD
jgi:hypothetical protein